MGRRLVRRRPYARQYTRDDVWPVTGTGWLLWLLFRMPGSLLIWWGYFFPRRGDVWASARRPGNWIMEVIYTLALYGVAAVTVVGWLVRR